MSAGEGMRRVPLQNIDFKNRGKVRIRVSRGGNQAGDWQAEQDRRLLIQYRERVEHNVLCRGGAGRGVVHRFKALGVLPSFLRLALRQAS